MVIRGLGPDGAAAYLALRLLALREGPTALGSSYEEECTRSVEQVRHALQTDFGRHLPGASIGQDLVGMVRHLHAGTDDRSHP